jgi:hypothetical protein
MPAMRPDIFYVLLELGSGPQYPYAEFGCRYQLFLPLTADGHVDTDALRADSGRYRGVRLRAGDGEANGRIVAGAGGKFVLAYDDFRFYPSTLLFGSAPLAAGNVVRIAEYDGGAQDYRVVSTRRVAAPFAEVAESA